MSTKLHTKSYNNNRLFLTIDPDEEIDRNDPVRVVDSIVESLDLTAFKKLYKEKGRSPYHPKMMLKIILYAYMNNIYSCRKIERQVHMKEDAMNNGQAKPGYNLQPKQSGKIRTSEPYTYTLKRRQREPK